MPTYEGAIYIHVVDYYNAHMMFNAAATYGER